MSISDLSISDIDTVSGRFLGKSNITPQLNGHCSFECMIENGCQVTQVDFENCLLSAHYGLTQEP
jgi:hypothetical protein